MVIAFISLVIPPRPCACRLTTTAVRQFRLALAQLSVTADKSANVQGAVEAIKTAAAAGANMIALPVSGHHRLTAQSCQECFNCPYGTSFFPEYAEPVPGPSTEALSKVPLHTVVWPTAQFDRLHSKPKLT